MRDTLDQLDCSVVVSTYNRRAFLIGTLDDLIAQRADGLTFEIIIVDNGSTDGTRELLARLLDSVPFLRYVYEPLRGPGHGRNTGIAHARGRIIAFTDDDNRVARDWVAQLVRAFDEHPDVDAVAGRILPKWSGKAPAWLTRDHWVGPLALQDYGTQRFVIDASRPLALCTANLAFRRSVLDKIGLFSSHLQRAEDTELLVRFWRSGGRCLYVPEARVAAAVQPERLTKEYHRQWHNANGAWTAVFDLAEMIDRDGSLRDKPPDTLRLGGVPAFVVRELMTMSWRWALATVRRSSRALNYEHRVRFLCGYISSRYRHHRSTHGPVHLSEIYTFVNALMKKKLRRQSRTPPAESTDIRQPSLRAAPPAPAEERAYRA